MNRDLLDLIRDALGCGSYAELIRLAGWNYKLSMSLIRRDTMKFKHYFELSRDIGAKWYIIVESKKNAFEIDLNGDAFEAINAICDNLHISKTDIGRMWGVDRATAWGRLHRVSITMEELVRILNLRDATINIVLPNNMIVYPEGGGDSIAWKAKDGEEGLLVNMVDTEFGVIDTQNALYHGDMRKMSEGEIFSTKNSSMISTFTDEEAGIVKDLFISNDGKYFFAVYEIKTLAPLRIQAATRDDARLFVAGHGTV